MTVITKNLGDKKSDNLEEPLVDNIVVEHNDEHKKGDMEAGGYPVPPPQTTRYIISARVRPYYSLIFILMLVLLVTTSLLGIFGTEYLYEQYRYLVGTEEKPEVFRAWGTLSFEDDPTAMAYETKVPARFEKTQDSMETDSIISEFDKVINKLKQQSAPVESDNDISKTIDKISQQSFPDELENEINNVINKISQQTVSILEPQDILFQQSSLGNNENEPGSQELKDEPAVEHKKELKEEFELDLNEDRYEKIKVPNGGASRFIHDFYSNYTAIVDEKNERCFVMPLDRSIILPPKSLYDLLFKMKDGYYSIDTEKVRKDMQVVMPAITDLEPYGIYIGKECQGYTSYKLEKFISGVVKRSSDVESVLFTHFAGSDLLEVNIVNLPISFQGPQALP